MTRSQRTESPLTAARTAAPSHRRLQQRLLEREADHFAAGEHLRASRTPDLGAREPGLVPGVGQPLPAAMQLAFERRLGVPLERLRIHRDTAAARAAEEEGAQAYTRGSSVVFGANAWRPDTPEGSRLIAHEVAHVAQQAQPGAPPTTQREPRRGEGIGRAPPSASFVNVEQGTGAEDSHILFSRDSATLRADHREALDSVIAGISGPVTVHVHGYASREGDEDYNRNLSAHRAVAVKSYLERALPEGSRVIAYAYGETTEFGGLRANRRVGIDVLEPSGLLLPSAGFSLGLGELSLGAPPPPPFGVAPLLELDPELEQLLRPRIPLAPALPTPAPIPWTTPFAPLPRFDAGAVAPDYAQRGLLYSARDARSYDEHYAFWLRRYIAWGLEADRAAWLAQKGTEFAARTQLSLEAPTAQERLDRALGTEPTIIPIMNDAIMRWLFEQIR